MRLKNGKHSLNKEVFCKMESVILDKLVVKNNRVDYYFTPSAKIEKYFKNNNMFVEYDLDISDIPVSMLVIPFVANVLPLMWLIDGILWVTDIDRTFYDAIPRIKHAYQELYPHYDLKGTIVPAYTTENTFMPEREAILLFSGGVDSNATFIRIKNKNPVLLNVQGWYETDIDDDKVYDADKRDITNFALANNVESHVVRSNFANVINTRNINKLISKKLKNTYWFGFQHALGFISIASLISYKKLIKRIYVAASYNIGYRTTCASDPTTDIQFKFATAGGVIHDGFDLSRQDRLKIVVDYQKLIGAKHPLRVCSFNYENCCACEKCFRTIAGIVAEGGEISNFSFNINNDLIVHFMNEMEKMIFDITDKTEVYRLATKKRMIENLTNISEPEFVEWFLKYNFKRYRNKAIFTYRIRNFISIIKRKISNLYH